MRIHHLQGYIQDMYLIEYPDKLLLLDAGCSCDAKSVLSFIKDDLGRNLKDLKVMVVTHVHPDHAGGVRQIKKATGCMVVTGDTQGYWYGGVSGVGNFLFDLVLLHRVANQMKKPFKFASYNPYFKAHKYLAHEASLPHFPDWQVLVTKGHTDRDLSLYHKETGTLYLADLIIKTKRGYISPFPIYLPKDYKQSLETVKSLPTKKMLLAHGGITVVKNEDITQLQEKAPDYPLTSYNVISRKLKKRIAKLR